MRQHFYRMSIVITIIGLALIWRGLGMGNATFLWSGVSLASPNIVLLLSSYCRSVLSGANGKPTSPDTAD